MTIREDITMTAQDRMERALDAALEMTFPASDPIAIYRPEEPNDGRAGESMLSTGEPTRRAA
jgi:hypothetical protein